MEIFDSIVIGGGAAGLMAARELCKQGKKVAVLEARERLGGRIHTLEDESFIPAAEAGAEFIHGDLPLTFALLKEANLSYHPISGEIYRFRKGTLIKEEGFVEDAGILIKRLHALTKDTSVASFLETYFHEEKYAELKASVKGYTEGYDAADTKRASAFALRDEWSGEEEGDQYRVDESYGSLVHFLEKGCREAGCSFYLSSIIKQVTWKKNEVDVMSVDGACYHASKAIIAIPLGVLQAGAAELASLSFAPVPTVHMDAIHSLGFGQVIKILLQFDEAFWSTGSLGEGSAPVKDPGWIFSDSIIPTWWTQSPTPSALLTGWLAGPKAEQFRGTDAKDILDKALGSLSIIFGAETRLLENKLLHWRVINWTADPFTLGAYAYSTIETPGAIKTLLSPVENTLFFAGEALHDGPQMGTVEGALQSGLTAAHNLLKSDG